LRPEDPTPAERLAALLDLCERAFGRMPEPAARERGLAAVRGVRCLAGELLGEAEAAETFDRVRKWWRPAGWTPNPNRKPAVSLWHTDEEWVLMYLAEGVPGRLDPEPDFRAALGSYIDAVLAARASTDPPWEPPAHYLPQCGVDQRRSHWRHGSECVWEEGKWFPRHVYRFPAVVEGWDRLGRLRRRPREAAEAPRPPDPVPTPAPDPAPPAPARPEDMTDAERAARIRQLLDLARERAAAATLDAGGTDRAGAAAGGAAGDARAGAG
jgi:hypothetical protein